MGSWYKSFKGGLMPKPKKEKTVNSVKTKKILDRAKRGRDYKYDLQEKELLEAQEKILLALFRKLDYEKREQIFQILFN